VNSVRFLAHGSR